MLRGSAQTLNTFGSTNSNGASGRAPPCAGPGAGIPCGTPCASAALRASTSTSTSVATAQAARVASHFAAWTVTIDLVRWNASGRDPCSLISHAACFRIFRGFGFLLVLDRPPSRDGVVGARPQIDEDVVEITHHVRIGAEGRHH